MDGNETKRCKRKPVGISLMEIDWSLKQKANQTEEKNSSGICKRGKDTGRTTAPKTGETVRQISESQLTGVETSGSDLRNLCWGRKT